MVFWEVQPQLYWRDDSYPGNKKEYVGEHPLLCLIIALKQLMNNLLSILVYASETEIVIYIPNGWANARAAPCLRSGENTQRPNISPQNDTNPHLKLHLSQVYYSHVNEGLTFFKLIITDSNNAQSQVTISVDFLL